MGVQTWDGTVRRSSLSEWAGNAREQLADAAKCHDWTTVLDLVHQHPHFVNSSRPDGPTWFAPLHQAAHGGVAPEFANRLIAAGAWRGLRTATGERPVDIARREGHIHLLGLLEPPRQIEIPPRVLSNLQDRFHAVVRERMREFRLSDELRLPELEVLLELDDPQLWFPVPGMHGGFRCRLETRRGTRLIADSWCRMVGGSEQRHEITESRSRQLGRPEYA